MKSSVKLSVENLTEEPYATILCYPHTKPLEVANRILELKELGVQMVEFTGSGSAANVSVIGKGYTGIVIIAHTNSEQLALKIRRIDSGRENFFHEAEMLQKANNVAVGPRILAGSKNFLLSQFVDGDFLTKWLNDNKDTENFCRVIRDVLEQCWRLDMVGLDHGELSKAPRHLLMDKLDKPFIVDFETASIQRRVANVTSVCQHFFVGDSFVSKLVWETLGKKSRSQIVNALQNYKKDKSRQNFETILQICL
ncbi:MAG: serine/threonine protein kinase [Nitrososphaerota archaeon]|jgi:putative serine/threonine protein kinase|nr:serine/threonine protein kinase [Nitrososphaerota archaeon]